MTGGLLHRQGRRGEYKRARGRLHYQPRVRRHAGRRQVQRQHRQGHRGKMPRYQRRLRALHPMHGRGRARKTTASTKSLMTSCGAAARSLPWKERIVTHFRLWSVVRWWSSACRFSASTMTTVTLGQPLAYDSQPNGATEVGVILIRRLSRTLKLFIGAKIEKYIPIGHALVS